MKSQITPIPLKEEKQTLKFPCLMKYISKEETIVVLFNSLNTGTVVYTDYFGYFMGEFSNDWKTELFSPIPTTEGILLQNE